MAIVPTRAVLGGLELVCESFSWRNWALRDTRDSIVVGSIELANAVPMDSGAVRQQVIGHMNEQVVAPVGGNGRTRESAVESHTGTHVSVLITDTLFSR